MLHRCARPGAHVAGELTRCSATAPLAHVDPCGATGAAAGPHDRLLQGGLTDPAADTENEIWLDVTTNAAGEGHARAVVARPFPSDRRPGSVIIHERHTSTGPGVAGVAGQRVACTTVPS